ncbi:peptidylprolyl isomerase [Anthocerotibacter panamensis]|uniref:peptidylprolyl isomerase n=1 Tax=Anthocerotibacter panamensis TaxID=2857077 RepID=UPI001C40418C|nr:peptidylprolyl isomerase [Anthocerotibacter panamensis]
MKKLLALGLALLLVGCSSEKKNKYSLSGLPNKGQFRDGELALRNALPPTGLLSWEIEQGLDYVAEQVEERQWVEGKEAITYALEVIGRNSDGVVAQAPSSSRAATRKALQDLRTSLRGAEDAVYKQDQGDGSLAVGKMYWFYDRVLLNLLAEHKPNVPVAWRDRPLLDGGWAIAEFDTTQGKFTVILDGFNAPVSAGNVADLIQRGFYDGLPIIRAQKNFLFQTGDPKGDGQGGFVEASTGKIRYVPLELRPARASRVPAVVPEVRRQVKFSIERYKLDPLKLREELKKIYEKYVAADVEAPLVYNQEFTQEEKPALPFTPPGTLALARLANKPESGSSQFFLSFADPELNPPGSNVEDGKYSVFGYLTAGVKKARKLQEGDVIKKARLLTCTETVFNNVSLVDYTATTLYVDKIAKGKLEMSCLPIAPPRLVNVAPRKAAKVASAP